MEIILENYTYILSVNLEKNTYKKLSGTNEMFSDEKLDTFSKLVNACATYYIVKEEKDLFIKVLDTLYLYQAISSDEFLNFAFKVFKNDKILYFTMKVIKENNFEQNHNVIITFEQATKEAYTKVKENVFNSAIAKARMTHYPVILVVNDDTLHVKALTNGKDDVGHVNWQFVKNYNDFVELVRKYSPTPERAMESIDIEKIKDYISSGKDFYETVIPMGRSMKLFIKLTYNVSIVQNQKYVIVALNDYSDEMNKSLRNERLSEEEKSIYKSLIVEFTSLFIVGYHTGRTSYLVLDSHNEFKTLMSSAKMSDSINLYINNYVHQDDKERIFRFFNFENLKMFLDKKNNAIVQFKRVRNNFIDHAIFSVAKVKSENDEDKIVIAIRPLNHAAEFDIKQKEVLSKLLDEKIQFDDLTHLYNRTEFIQRTEERLNEKYDDNYYIVQFDIDRFSVFNDLYGISQGDNLLKSIANILVDMGAKYELVYSRLSNDIFAVLLHGDIKALNKFVNELKDSIKPLSDYFDLNISVGAYKIIDKTISVESMLDYCHQASKTIKKKYVKTFAMYDEEMFEGRKSEQKIINRMNQALASSEFHIFLQPKYDIFKNKLVGAESLVRWIKNDEIIQPNMFIPVFEQNGFITKLDYYVWEETLKYLSWRKENNLELFPISVNVSRTFLAIPNFKTIIENLVDKYNIEHKYFELEITETLFSDIDLVKEKVKDLRKAGFKILMDDFGSGYSALNVLKDVEFDVLKIDLKFFSNDSEKSQKIVESVINLAKTLNIPAIAEGVETEDYVEILKKYGCQYAQGFYYDEPLGLESFNKKYN